jgi:N-acylneuraminate cytidylyltransferase
MTKQDINRQKLEICETYFGYSGIDIEHFTALVAGPRDKRVVHIPARSGSTRIENKNIKELCGVPLIAYTIAVARAMPVDRVIVNTDSPEIAAVAERLGAEVPFLRPAELSGDDVSPGFAGYYAERFLLSQGYPLDIMIDMYPTSPFRNAAKLTRYTEDVVRSGYCATAFLPNMELGRVRSREGLLLGEEGARCERGRVHFKLLASFLGRRLLSGQKRWFQYELIDDPIELVDIDTPEDFALAEFIIENDLYEFGVAI